MKKRFSVIFAFMAFIFTIGCFTTFKSKISYASIEETTTCNFNLSSKSAYLCDASSNNVIFKLNETKHMPIASMCKIMTLLLTFDEVDSGNLSFDEDITVSSTASGMGGSQVFLETNGIYKTSELIKSIVVASANDACVAIAEKICGSEEAFVDRMNQKSSELGMNDTCFVNCTGLPKPGQFSCAKDVAKMFSELIKHQDYFNYSTIWMDEIHHSNDRITQISNTNKLIRFYNGCDSGKTGYTSEAGHCLTASAERNGTRLISVIISAPDSKTRFNEASTMFNFGFANYTNKLILDNSSPLDVELSIRGGKKEKIEVIAKEPIYIFSNKNDKRAFEIDINPVDLIKAPIKKGDCLGEIRVFENGIEIASTSIISNENIDKASYFDNVKNVIDNWSLI